MVEGTEDGMLLENVCKTFAGSLESAEGNLAASCGEQQASDDVRRAWELTFNARESCLLNEDDQWIKFQQGQPLLR